MVGFAGINHYFGCIFDGLWSLVVEKQYSKLIPSQDGPRNGFHICPMAQIYLEDRGPNYAIQVGRVVVAHISKLLSE